jgi:hypothetical protein
MHLQCILWQLVIVNIISNIQMWEQVRGSEVILGADSHITVYEQGGISTLGGVHPRTIPNKLDGTMDLAMVEAAIRPLNDDHYPATRLICIENSQARCTAFPHSLKAWTCIHENSSNACKCQEKIS